MDIFESLENLPVSEECFYDIMGIVEDKIAKWEETHNMGDLRKKGNNAIPKRTEVYQKNLEQYGSNHPKTKKAYSRLEYAKNLVGQGDGGARGKYPNDLKVGDAKKYAEYYSGIPTGNTESAQSLRNRADKATPTDYAVYSIGKKIKPKYATGSRYSNRDDSWERANAKWIPKKTRK